MKRLKNWFTGSSRVMTSLSAFAMAFVMLAANSRCSYCFHQPELPKAADKFKKF